MIIENTLKFDRIILYTTYMATVFSMISKFNFFCLIVFLLGFSNSNSKAQGNDLAITNNIYFDGEPYLISKPSEPNKLTIAWMGFNLPDGIRITIRSRTSTDGGLSWSAPVSLPHLDPAYGSADPTMAYGPDGTLYLVYIDYKKNPDAGKIVLCKSTDSGLTWSGPTPVMDMTEDFPERPIDRPWLIADDTNGPTSGNLYLTSKPAPWIPAPNRSYHKRSTDGGLTWSGLRFVDTTNYLIGNLIQQPMASPMVYADGKYAMLYPSYVPAQNIYGVFYQALSADGGQSFQYNTALVNFQGVQDTNYKLVYHGMAHPTDPNQAVLVGTSNANGDPDILLSRTTDQGATWGPYVRVNQDGLANGKAQDMVWAAYNEQGHVAVVWRDRRNDSGSGFFVSSEIYGAVSKDGGVTFQPDFPLTSVPAAFDSILLESGNDILGVEFCGDTVYAAWGDVRTGKLNIYFSRKVLDGSTAQVQVLTEDYYPPISMHPNPVSTQTKVFFAPEYLGGNWQIHDVQGTLMFSGNIEQEIQLLSVEGLSAGAYLLSGNKGSLKCTLSFVK